LVAPSQDAEALARVLADPAIGGFEVQTLLNEPSYEVNRAIEAFFTDRKRDDLLLYFSGHGIKDEEGRLYRVFPSTDSESYLEGLTDSLHGVGQGNSAQDESGNHGHQENGGHFCYEAIP